MKLESDQAQSNRDDPMHSTTIDMPDGFALAQSNRATNPMLRKAESFSPLKTTAIPDGGMIQKIAEEATRVATPLGTSELRDEAMPDGLSLAPPVAYLGGNGQTKMVDAVAKDPMHIEVA